MFDVIVYYFLILVLFIVSVAGLIKTLRYDTPFPYLLWTVCAFIVWSIPVMTITNHYHYKNILQSSCAKAPVTSDIERHFNLETKILNGDGQTIEDVSNDIDEYNDIDENFDSCIQAFDYFYKNDYYRYSWLNSFSEFTNHSLGEPSELVAEYRSSIFLINVYLGLDDD